MSLANNLIVSLEHWHWVTSWWVAKRVWCPNLFGAIYEVAKLYCVSCQPPGLATAVTRRLACPCSSEKHVSDTILSCGHERQGLLAAQSKHGHDAKDPASGKGSRRVRLTGDRRVVAANVNTTRNSCMVEPDAK